MGAPYRGQEFEGGADFAQHIRIAEHCLQELVDLAARYRRFLEDDLAPDEAKARHVELRVKSLWDDAWAQLDEASSLVQANDRGVGDYEAARRAARACIWPLTFSYGPWMRTAFGRRRSVSGRLVSVAPIRNALTALRAAVPEVIVQRPRQDEVPDLRRRVYWPWLVGLALLAWTASRYL